MIALWIVAIFALYFSCIGICHIIETDTRHHWHHVGRYNRP